MLCSLEDDQRRRGVMPICADDDRVETTAYPKPFVQRPAFDISTASGPLAQALEDAGFMGSHRDVQVPAHRCPDRIVCLICDCESQTENVDQVLFDSQDSVMTIKVGVA